MFLIFKYENVSHSQIFPFLMNNLEIWVFFNYLFKIQMFYLS